MKFIVLSIFFFNFFLNTHATEKEFIIRNLSKVKNFTFDFKQIVKKKIETGNCTLVFNNKLKCSYNDKMQKEIIVNNKTLVVLQKRYNKIYFYPISKSPFVNILNKNRLINLIQKSDITISDNIELLYLDENEKKITVFFAKENYELIGWLVEDRFQNEIYFSLKITKINSKVENKIFNIPRID